MESGFNQRTAAGILGVCLLALATRGIAAPAPGDDKPVGEGLTRESLSETRRSDPAQAKLPPLAPPPAVSASPAPARTVSSARAVHRSARSQRRRPLIVHRQPRTRSYKSGPPAPTVVVHPRPRRNPVVKFVYWWNGFVIRKLHTKVGTVLLGTIGADA